MPTTKPFEIEQQGENKFQIIQNRGSVRVQRAVHGTLLAACLGIIASAEPEFGSKAFDLAKAEYKRLA